MKKSAYIWIAVAVFAGVFGAQIASHYLQNFESKNAMIHEIDTLPTASFASDSLEAGPKDFSAAAAKVLPSVVSIDNFQTETDFWNDQTSIQRAGTGSGVILSPNGIIVTNNHVVAGASQVRVRLSDKRTLPAKVLGADPQADLAVLKINAANLTPISLGDSKKIKVGQWVIAVGNPLDFSATVSVGVVSNLGRTLPTENGGILVHAIQTDAAINPGNSGGALTDENGNLIGINTAIISPTGSSIGIGFAIPSDRVRQIVHDIIQTGHSMQGILGLVPRARWDGLLSDPRARAELAQATGADNVPDHGLVVPYGDPNSGAGLVAGLPAARAGLKPLDIILTIDDKPMTDHYALLAALAEKRAGDVVTIRYWSRGTTKTIKVTLVQEGQSA